MPRDAVKVKTKPGNGKDLLPIPKARKSRKVDPVKALQLKERGYTNQDIADKFGVGPSAISNTLKRTRELILNTSELKEYRTKEVDILDSAKARLISAISEEKIEKAPLGTLTLAYCQLADKSLLMQGKATQNINIRDVVTHLHDQEQALRRELEALDVVVGPQDTLVSKE